MAQNLGWVLGGGSLAAAVGVAGYFVTQVGFENRPEPDPVPFVEAVPTAPVQSVPATVNETPADTPETPVEAARVPADPAFDIVRVARDGDALVAGLAAPGAVVRLQVDGEQVAETQADASGQFAALFDLGHSDSLQVLTLESALDGAEAVQAPDRVILTPRPAPEVEVASAAPVEDQPPVETAPAPVQGARLEAAEILAEAALSAPVLAEAPMVEDAPEDAPEDQAAAPLANADEVHVAEVELNDEIAELPTALLLRDTGEVEFIDRAPQVMDNVVIDTISYSAEGDVQILGRAAGAAEQANVRIYLDNSPIAVASAQLGDWRLDLPNVDPGVYTLRVDQIDTAGQVVSRFETPFQREDPQVVQAARASAAERDAAQSEPVAEATSVEGTDQTEATEVAAPAMAEAAVEIAEVATAAVAPAVSQVTAEAQSPAVAEPSPSAPNTQPVAQTAQLASASQVPEQATVEQTTAEQTTPGVTTPAPTTPAPEPVATHRASVDDPISLITVQPGHTLWAISTERYGSGDLYVQIYRANRSQIRNPDLIYPGQIFTLPQDAE